MATAKKKPSAAQIAARKLFAQRAKAGTLRKAPAKRKKNPVKKAVAVKRNPVKKAATVKRNPVKRGPSFRNHVTGLEYRVRLVSNGQPGHLLAAFDTKALATEYGHAYVKAHGKAVVICDE
jgi:hypothetical protein